MIWITNSEVEMNIFVPQSVQAQLELLEICNVKKQVITPRFSSPILGAIMDTVTGAYNLTSPDVKINWDVVMNIVSYTSFDDFKKIKKGKEYTGKELFSLILPAKVNIDNGGVKIENGELKEGKIGKNMIGAKSNSIIHNIWNQYGVDETKTFLNDLQRLIINFNFWNGFSVGIGDALIPKEVDIQMNTLFETRKLELDHQITEMENNPELMTEEAFERNANGMLGALREDVGKLIMNNLPNDNRFKIMIESGAKGSTVNIAQIRGCVGQQAIEGKRAQKKLNGRTLCYYFQNDDRAMARGFVQSNFLNGLTLTEFIFHNMAGREGLIDTAIKSVTGDTPIIIMENNKPKRIMIGEWIDEKLKDNNDIEYHEEHNMELLKLKDNENVTIPTTDNKGNISWGKVTAVTRHDHENELYKIRTHGGRKVIVAKSKSLLIWNEDTKEYQMKHSDLVKVGDYVPVTQNLPIPSINNNESEEQLVDLDLSEEIAQYITDNKIINVNNKQLIQELVGVYPDNYLSNKILCSSEEFKHVLLDRCCADIVQGFQEFRFANNTIRDYFILLATTINYYPYRIDDCYIEFYIDNEDDEEIIDCNDTVLDKIIEITKIDASEYPKVYDLTVPSTLNFGLANGLHVVDTAESGYIQRKLIKSMEDFSVKYDMTVRNSRETIFQYVYGDSGIDTSKQYKHNMNIIEMSDKEVRDNYSFTKEELQKVDFSEKDNEELYKTLIVMRDQLRRVSLATALNKVVLEKDYMMPIHFHVTLSNAITNKVESKGKLTAKYILEKYDEILSYDKTMIGAMSKKTANNEKSIKAMDERNAKMLFKIGLYTFLNPKRLIFKVGMNKSQFDGMCERIIKEFNSNIVEPGEMVGVIASQSLGEPVTQLTLNTFHFTGIGAMGTATLGVPRIKELLSLSKNIKTPITIIRLTDEYKENREVAENIASSIKYTTLSDVIIRVDVSYEPDAYRKDGPMEKDNANNIYYVRNPNKYSCQNNIASLPWLMRLELDREQMIEKNISLLDIKTRFCHFWGNRYNNLKTIKKEQRKIIDKITQCAIITNNDNDRLPVAHIRFDMKDFEKQTIIGFYEYFISELMLKGIEGITKADVGKEKVATINSDGSINSDTFQYTIYTAGVNLTELSKINGIDFKTTVCNDVIATYEEYGIEAARTLLLKEMNTVFSTSGNDVNYQHLSLLSDLITNTGKLTSIDRHGLNKLDTDPLSRASFEKTVDQFINAGIFGQTDYMNSVSSRIMAGMPIKGGTGLCQLKLDVKKLEQSEYMEEYEFEYGKEFDEITTNEVIDDVLSGEQPNIFIPM